MRRRSDGSYEEIDWDTAISEIAEGFKHIRDTYGGDKVFYYGGGGQGNHLGGAYSGAFLKAIGSRYRSNALAQEKTGEHWVDRHLYGGHTRGEFEHAEVSVFVGKNPWMSQSFPRARDGAQRDRQGSRPLDDRHRSGDHRHRQDGRLPSARAAGRRCVVPGGDGRCAGTGKPLQRSVFGRARQRRRRRARGAATRCRSASTRSAAASTRSCCAPRCAGSHAPTAWRSSRTSAFSRRPTARSCSYLNKLLWILTGSFAKRGGQHLHSSFAPLFSHRRGRPHTRHRRSRSSPGWCRPTCARRDPDRSSGPVPGDDRREQQPRPLRRRLGVGAGQRSSRWNSWWSSTSR